MIRYEWHRPNPGELAGIADADELRELTDDDSDITDTTLGVCYDDGGGGGMVYGEPAVLLDYYTRICQALAARIGAPAPDGARRP